MKLIVFQPSAARALDGIRSDMRMRLETALADCALNGTGDTKRMSGTNTVRLRIGDYRIIFDETADRLTILVIGHRREIYR